MAAAEIEVSIPNMRYDITMPLIEGRVKIDGVRVKPGPGVPGTILAKDSPMVDGNFGLVDLNWGNLLPAIDAGWELIALPIFQKRKHVYTYVFCRKDAGINAPQDLEGKRIGMRGFRSSIGIWLRGLLRQRYATSLDRVHWVVTGKELFPMETAGLDVEEVDPKQSLVDRLLDGELHALMTDISDGELWERLENNPQVRRLFPDYREEDRRLYQDTGTYTPVHVLGMSRKLDRQHPDLAGKLFGAFERSKQIAYNDIMDDRGGFSVVYFRERFREQMEQWGDPFKYGITANKHAIDDFNSYNVEQGLARAHSYEDIFAASTLDT